MLITVVTQQVLYILAHNLERLFFIQSLECGEWPWIYYLWSLLITRYKIKWSYHSLDHPIIDIISEVCSATWALYLFSMFLLRFLVVRDLRGSHDTETWALPMYLSTPYSSPPPYSIHIQLENEYYPNLRKGYHYHLHVCMSMCELISDVLWYEANWGTNLDISNVELDEVVYLFVRYWPVSER